jgi:hypothetical protein
VAWDLHDLKDKAEDAISNYKLTKEIAQNGQELYRKVMIEPLLFVNSVRNLLF